MQTIQASTYPVHFQKDSYKELSSLIKEKAYSSLFILVDENTMTHCYSKFIPFLDTDTRIEVIEIEPGEEFKNLQTSAGVWNALSELDADRKSLLITLGGGVITDLGGFIASTFKRGIDFVNIPTTLLSMVDASVGGKTGIDLGVLKNQIGLFSNPKMVIVDTDYLTTLSDREVRSGMAEIIKYGLTYDIKLLQEVKESKNHNFNDLVFKSIQIKNTVVLEDPKENGLRKILNFGHTIGHAIESYFLENPNKEKLTHGEAISIGMICECYISYQLLNLQNKKVDSAKELILSIFDKVQILAEDFDPIIALLKHDKKNVAGQVNFVLLNDFEDCQLDCKVPNDLIIESLEYYNS
ncbi:3-dehydroquinate synthase [Flavobacteriaceae bacterium S356]|uniref:3-dehydroquinate synthase n=1 Tax=Asprobacillus argus TaxID=3076534 RepID=A0ABU3LEJ8_9FLAO|nr:3-dehydroquinate synthase [Flavobacteriaceae bacterium S356]